MATSLFTPEIETLFKGATTLEVRASDVDIDQYLQANLPYLPGFVSRHTGLQVEIKQDIKGCVDETFLLAQLHLEPLRAKHSPKAIRMALKTLTKGSNAYNGAYEDAMNRINGQPPEEKEFAFQSLSWITYAKRPLTLIELRHALAVELNKPEFDDSNLSDLQDIVSVCCGLGDVRVGYTS